MSATEDSELMEYNENSDLSTGNALDLTLKTIIEFRDEMREFRTETRKTLAEHPHRFNVIEATIASLRADVGILLSSVPVARFAARLPAAVVAFRCAKEVLQSAK